MSTQVKGPFDVTLNPQPPYDTAGGVTLSRMSIEKRFHGELDASSRVEMLSALSQVQGSAGYVAIERVSGKLKGRTGAFVLQHFGTMTRGKPELKVSVVPDSGSGDLQGLAGDMTIEIVDGNHFYTFDFTITPVSL